MKLIKKSKLVILFLFPITIVNSTSDLKTEHKIVSSGFQVDISDTLFNKIINHIKQYEKFSSDIYIDTDGSKTIGYGHHIQKNEKLTKITEEEAEKLLISDYLDRVKQVKSIHKLTGTKLHSISMFVYNCGIGTYNKSTLRKYVEQNKKIDNIIVMYNKYRMDSIYYTSNSLSERREFELEIYNL